MVVQYVWVCLPDYLHHCVIASVSVWAFGLHLLTLCRKRRPTANLSKGDQPTHEWQYEFDKLPVVRPLGLTLVISIDVTPLRPCVLRIIPRVLSWSEPHQRAITSHIAIKTPFNGFQISLLKGLQHRWWQMQAKTLAVLLKPQKIDFVTLFVWFQE